MAGLTVGTVPGRRPDTGGEERREGQRATPARSEPGLSGLPQPLPRWPLLCWFAAKRGLWGQEPQTSGVRRRLCPGRGRASHPGGPRSGTPRQHWAPASLDWCAQEARAARCHSPPRGPARGGPSEVLGLVRRLLCPAFHPESHGGCVARCAASTAPPCGQQPLGRLRAWDGVGLGADFLPLLGSVARAHAPNARATRD